MRLANKIERLVKIKILAGKVLRDSLSLDKKLEFGVWRFGVVSVIKRVVVIYWSLEFGFGGLASFPTRKINQLFIS
jgi:hypothetical protein